MVRLILTDLVSLANESSAITTINANSTAIETEVERSLSRYAVTPNAMESDLDMNGNNLLNLPAPGGPTEPLRLGDISEYITQLDGTSTLLPAAVTGDIDKIPRVAAAGLMGYSNIGIDTSHNIRPETTDVGALGTATLMWADLFLALGAVINFNNGDVTLTHSADTLTVAGGTFATAALTGTTGVFSGALSAASLAATAAITGATLTTTGAISGNSLAATLGITGDTLALTGALTAASVATTGNITSTAGTIGYATGGGGTVTQATSKSTGVTLNKQSGQITMNNAALAAATEVSFVVTNSFVAATDVVVVSIGSGGTLGAYQVDVAAVGAGSFTIMVSNATAGSLGEAIVINFAVIKGASA